MQACSLTDVGCVRDHNEDCFGEDPALGLWIVADGMGGHAAGEVASDLAVSSILRLVADGRLLPDAVGDAHHIIRQAPMKGIGTPGMGTTVVAAQLSGVDYRICWVGDSRAYIHGKDGLKRLTRDHSYVQHLVDSGAISAAEAEIHPERSVVTQCLGAEPLASVQVSEVTGQLHLGETLLLCSDGLTGEVGDAAIETVLAEDSLVFEKAQELIDLANAKGGGDNITVALIPAPADAPPKSIQECTREIRTVSGRRSRNPVRRRFIPWASVAMVSVVTLAAWLVADWYRPSSTPVGGGGDMPPSPPDSAVPVQMPSRDSALDGSDESNSEPPSEVSDTSAMSSAEGEDSSNMPTENYDPPADSDARARSQDKQERSKTEKSVNETSRVEAGTGDDT